jgi:multiple sugar transport system permease protein
MTSRRVWMIVRFAIFALMAFAFNFPLIATIVTSFKSEAEIGDNPTLSIIEPTLSNYRQIRAVGDRFDILHYLTNSIAAAGVGAALAMILAFPAAYAIARAGVGARWMLPIVTNLRAIPLIIFSIPIYLVYQQIHLLDTRIGLALILALVNLPLVLALLVNSLRDLPIGIEEAARIDGAGTAALLLRIVLPLSAPVVASALILSFIYAWNEFLFGLMLTTERAVPITVGASFFFSASGGGVRWGVASAVMVVSVLPPLLISLLAYRFIGRALSMGAVKE